MGEYYYFSLSPYKGLIQIKAMVSRRDRDEYKRYTKSFCAAPLVEGLNFVINNKRLKKSVRNILECLEEAKKTAE